MYPELSLATLPAMSQEREELGQGAPNPETARAPGRCRCHCCWVSAPCRPTRQVLNAGCSLRRQERETLVNLYLELNGGGSAHSMNCTFTEGTTGKPAAAE